MAAQDSELQSFRYRIDLIAFAKATGYEICTRDSAENLTILEHPNRDRIVVAQAPDGAWIYASANRYEPRRSEETPAQAERRLHDCIARTKDKGTIVEFVGGRDCTAQHPPVSLECVRERLHLYMDERVPLDFHGALCTPAPERPILPRRELRSGDRVDGAATCQQASSQPLRHFLVVTQSPAHAGLYYQQCGKALGHTRATAAYMSVGAEGPPGRGWDLGAVDKRLAALPSGASLIAALPASPAGDRLAGQLRGLAFHHPQVKFERHTLRIEREIGIRRASGRSPLRAGPACLDAEDRGR